MYQRLRLGLWRRFSRVGNGIRSNANELFRLFRAEMEGHQKPFAQSRRLDRTREAALNIRSQMTPRHKLLVVAFFDQRVGWPGGLRHALVCEIHHSLDTSGIERLKILLNNLFLRLGRRPGFRSGFDDHGESCGAE